MYSYIYSFIPNVRGQGTRHLVEGTLDPLVGRLFILEKAAAPVLVNRGLDKESAV